MATVNFRVPDEIKAAFDQAFGDQNKSAIIAELMRRAVREQQLRNRREELFRRLSSARVNRPRVTSAAIRRTPGGGQTLIVALTAVRDVEMLAALELPTTENPAVTRRATRLAIGTRHPLFGTLYHAVALEHDEAILVTADDRYYRNARRHGTIATLREWESGA